MNHAEIYQQHVDDIGADRTEADCPGMHEASAQSFVELSRIDGADRCRQGQTQNHVTYKYVNVVHLLDIASLFSQCQD